MAEEFELIMMSPQLAPTVGGVAPDDPLWLMSCSRAEIVSLIHNPYQWVCEVNARHNPKQHLVLAPEFVMRVTLSKRVLLSSPAIHHSPPACEYLVQGINGTGVIIIRPVAPVTKDVEDRWGGYWNEWRDTTKLRVTTSVSAGLGFGHLELWTPDSPPGSPSIGSHSVQRADRITAFLMWGADPSVPDSGSQGDFYINRMLRKNVSTAGDMDSRTGIIRETQRSGPIFNHLNEAQLSNVTFTYVGRQIDFEDCVSPPATARHMASNVIGSPSNEDSACNDMAGAIDEKGMINLDDVVVKAYNPIISSP